jgi:transposase
MSDGKVISAFSEQVVERLTGVTGPPAALLGPDGLFRAQSRRRPAKQARDHKDPPREKKAAWRWDRGELPGFRSDGPQEAAYLGLVPRRNQSGEVHYSGGISKCGDRRLRTLLYEAANVMLTRYKGPLKLKA